MAERVQQGESPSAAVKRLVAKREECKVEQLGNLTEAIDVEELNECENQPIEFRYCGYQVTVTEDKTITIES